MSEMYVYCRLLIAGCLLWAVYCGLGTTFRLSLPPGSLKGEEFVNYLCNC